MWYGSCWIQWISFSSISSPFLLMLKVILSKAWHVLVCSISLINLGRFGSYWSTFRNISWHSKRLGGTNRIFFIDWKTKSQISTSALFAPASSNRCPVIPSEGYVEKPLKPVIQIFESTPRDKNDDFRCPKIEPRRVLYSSLLNQWDKIWGFS